MTCYVTNITIKILGVQKMIPPQELKNKNFTRAGKGYDMADVDEYMDFIVEKYSEIYSQCDKYDKKLRIVSARISEIQSEEETIRKLSISTQKHCDRLIAEAEETARETILSAQETAAEIIGDAKDRAQTALSLIEKKAVAQIELTQKKSDALLMSARTRCAKLLGEFKREIYVQRENILNIKDIAEEFNSRLLSMYKNHLSLLTEHTYIPSIDMDTFSESNLFDAVMREIKSDAVEIARKTSGAEYEFEKELALLKNNRYPDYPLKTEKERDEIISDSEDEDNEEDEEDDDEGYETEDTDDTDETGGPDELDDTNEPEYIADGDNEEEDDEEEEDYENTEDEDDDVKVFVKSPASESRKANPYAENEPENAGNSAYTPYNGTYDGTYDETYGAEFDDEIELATETGAETEKPRATYDSDDYEEYEEEYDNSSGYNNNGYASQGGENEGYDENFENYSDSDGVYENDDIIYDDYEEDSHEDNNKKGSKGFFGLFKKKKKKSPKKKYGQKYSDADDDDSDNEITDIFGDSDGE